MKNLILTSLFSVFLLMAGCSTYQTSDQTSASLQSAAADYEIELIDGSLYRARSGNHYTVFQVTSEGTILGDPLDLGFANWLKAELAGRFDSTVRYVLYSHHHWDHASGAAAFTDTAVLVGHENMISALELPLPANYIRLDKNGDSVIQRTEAAGGLAVHFDRMDENGDGEVSGAEINQDIVVPSVTYSERFNVSLGGSDVQVFYTGTHHSNDGSILYFPNEKMVHGVDFVNVRRLPFGFSGTEFTPWLAAIDMMLALDFEILAPGHGEIGNRQDLMDYRNYFMDLRHAVGTRAHQGMSVEDIQQEIKKKDLEAYSEWDGFDTRQDSNAAEIYQRIVED